MSVNFEIEYLGQILTKFYISNESLELYLSNFKNDLLIKYKEKIERGTNYKATGAAKSFEVHFQDALLV